MQYPQLCRLHHEDALCLFGKPSKRQRYGPLSTEGGMEEPPKDTVGSLVGGSDTISSWDLDATDEGECGHGVHRQGTGDDAAMAAWEAHRRRLQESCDRRRRALGNPLARPALTAPRGPRLAQRQEQRRRARAEVQQWSPAGTQPSRQEGGQQNWLLGEARKPQARGQQVLPAGGQQELPARGEQQLLARGEQELPAREEQELPARGEQELPARGQQEPQARGRQARSAGEQQVLPKGEQQERPAGGQQELPAGGQQELQAGGQQEVPAGGQQEVPAGGQQEAPAGGQQEVPARGQQEVPARGKQEVPARGQQELPAEGQQVVEVEMAELQPEVQQDQSGNRARPHAGGQQEPPGGEQHDLPREEQHELPAREQQAREQQAVEVEMAELQPEAQQDQSGNQAWPQAGGQQGPPGGEQHELPREEQQKPPGVGQLPEREQQAVDVEMAELLPELQQDQSGNQARLQAGGQQEMLGEERQELPTGGQLELSGGGQQELSEGERRELPARGQLEVASADSTSQAKRTRARGRGGRRHARKTQGRTGSGAAAQAGGQPGVPGAPQAVQQAGGLPRVPGAPQGVQQAGGETGVPGTPQGVQQAGGQPRVPGAPQGVQQAGGQPRVPGAPQGLQQAGGQPGVTGAPQGAQQPGGQPRVPWASQGAQQAGGRSMDDQEQQLEEWCRLLEFDTSMATAEESEADEEPPMPSSPCPRFPWVLDALCCILKRLKSQPGDEAATLLLLAFPHLILAVPPKPGIGQKALITERLGAFWEGRWQELFDSAMVAARPAVRPLSYTCSDQDPDAIRLSRCRSRCKVGEWSRGLACLTAGELARPSEAMVQSLREKHPASAGEVPQWVRDFTIDTAQRPSLTTDILARAIHTAARASAAEPSGWVTEHLRDTFLTEPSCLSHLLEVFNQWVAGHVPERARPWLAASNLVGLSKPNGDVRPVAIGEVLPRILARALCISLCPAMVSYFLPCNQLGAGTRVGVEILTHSFRSALATHPDWCALQIDVANAFDSFHRHVMFDGLRESPFSGMIPFLRVFYGTPSDLYLRAGPFVQSLESARGSRQGDSLGPFLFAFTQQQVMEPVTREFKDLLFLSYADDTYILGPAARILEAFGVLRERLEWVGLEVQPHKCRFWEREGKEVERALPLGMQRVDEGLTVVGVPIGEEVWEVVRLREQLRQFQAPLPWLQLLDHPQMASHLLAIAISARPMYLARTMLPRPEVVEAFMDWDSCLEDCFEQLFPRGTWEQDPDRSRPARMQLHLPVRLGGFGIRAAASLSPLSYVCGWAQAARDIAQLGVAGEEAMFAEYLTTSTGAEFLDPWFVKALEQLPATIRHEIPGLPLCVAAPPVRLFQARQRQLAVEEL
ncbi:unnamed protein product [Closterium sp. NIES-54]